MQKGSASDTMRMQWIGHRRKRTPLVKKDWIRTCRQFKTWSPGHFKYSAARILLQHQLNSVWHKMLAIESNWRKTIREAIEIKIRNSSMNRGVGNYAYHGVTIIMGCLHWIALYDRCNIYKHKTKTNALPRQCDVSFLVIAYGRSAVIGLFALSFIFNDIF